MQRAWLQHALVTAQVTYLQADEPWCRGQVNAFLALCLAPRVPSVVMVPVAPPAPTRRHLRGSRLQTGPRRIDFGRRRSIPGPSENFELRRWIATPLRRCRDVTGSSVPALGFPPQFTHRVACLHHRTRGEANHRQGYSEGYRECEDVVVQWRNACRSGRALIEPSDRHGPWTIRRLPSR